MWFCPSLESLRKSHHRANFHISKMWVKTPTRPGLCKARRECMETASTTYFYSGVAVIIITINSKALSLNFGKKQSLQLMICSQSLKNENSPRPPLLRGQDLRGCTGSSLLSLLKYYFQLRSAPGCLTQSLMSNSRRERREFLQGWAGGAGFIFYLLLAFWSYKSLTSLNPSFSSWNRDTGSCLMSHGEENACEGSGMLGA